MIGARPLPSALDVLDQKKLSRWEDNEERPSVSQRPPPWPLTAAWVTFARSMASFIPRRCPVARGNGMEGREEEKEGGGSGGSLREGGGDFTSDVVSTLPSIRARNMQGTNSGR